MYSPRGFGLSEVGDVEVLAAGDELHLFHLTLPNHDVVQHAVSNDGLTWRTLPAALRTGDPGECDDDQIWTMSVTERDGAYVMLYTALSRADDGMVQRTALARSNDLIHWAKSDRNPVGSTDARWYEADVASSGRVSWRDPKPIRVGETYFAAVCARERSGPLLRRGCVGLLASPDLESWEGRPPLFAPRRYWDLECPQVFEIDGSFYLTAGIMEDRSQRYWVAPRFEGPYEVPADGGILAPHGHYAGRVCRWQGLDLYFCWHQPSYRTPVFGLPPDVDWTTVRNPHGKFVVAPLVLSQRSDGTLARGGFPGWSTYQEHPLTPALPRAASLFRGNGMEPDDFWEIVATGGTMDVLTMPETAPDFWLEGILTLDAGMGGLAFRLGEEGGGYFIELRRGTTDVSLQKWLPVHSPHDGRPWFTFDEVQRGHLARPLAAGDQLPFRLIVVGPYIECSLGNEVRIATLSAQRTTGQIGIWVESGVGRATEVRWAPMRAPLHG